MPAGAATRTCTTGAAIGTFDLRVQPDPDASPRVIRSINILKPGGKVLYRPVDIPAADRKDAEVTLVLLPAGEVTEHTQVTVLDPKPAKDAAEWVIPFRVGSLAVVFGPQGLEAKKVGALMEKNREMVLQLADYAEKTQATEALISALVTQSAEPNSSQNVDTAMRAFAAQYGSTPGKLDRTATGDQQALAMLKALNPSLASYDPLTTQPSARMAQSASLATAVAGLFLGNSVGLAAGGAAVLVNMRTMMFPNTEFRSALVQPTKDETMSLCGKRDAKSHTRIAFLWAMRVPDQAAPALALSAAAHVPLGLKSSLALKRVSADEWKTVDRAHSWRLEPLDSSAKPVPVTVRTASENALELDLARATPAPGAYRLSADWDWTPIRVDGEVSVHPVPNLSAARLTPASRDRLVEGAGQLTVELAGPDFQFVEKVELQKVGDRRNAPAAVPFDLVKGKRGGTQERISLDLDTRTMERADYLLQLTQSDGKRQDVPVRVLPPNPKLANTPIRVNLGEKEQTITLEGSGLDRITHISAEGAQVELAPGGNAGARRAIVRLGSTAERGQRISLVLSIADHESPSEVKEALAVAGPRPKIAQVQPALPSELTVGLAPGELPAGSAVSFAMRVNPPAEQPRVSVACAEARRTLTALNLRPGERAGTARAGSAGDGVLFVSFDPGEVGQPGCQLQAVVETEAEGRSDPGPLGRVLRLPRIEALEVTSEKLDDATYAATLRGQDLEMVEKTGWDSDHGTPVRGLPAPVAGDSRLQVLSIALPWPSPGPRSPLYVWLRGETKGRRTTAKY
jgi:hypothetical protein